MLFVLLVRLGFYGTPCKACVSMPVEHPRYTNTSASLDSSE